MEPLTDRQQQALDFIRERLEEGRAWPSMREIAAKLGLRSPSAPHLHVEALIRKGWLQRVNGGTNRLQLVERRQEKRVPAIPVLGAIPAGPADMRDQHVEKLVYIDVTSLRIPKGARVFGLRVTGDSMVGRHILDGDIVILEQGAEPRHRDIVAALIDGQSTLKTFVREGKRVFLRAENPKYPNLIPAEELMIQGVLRMVMREPKLQS